MPNAFYAIENPAIFFAEFPKLPKSLKPSSPATGKYICFSLAVGDVSKIWYPAKYCKWFRDIPMSLAVSTFEALFSKLGYIDSGPEFERGYRKIAIYAIKGKVTHVAVQPPDKSGLWHSKMGANVNILHSLDSIAGGQYGEVVKYMREQKPSRASKVKKLAITLT